MSPFCHMSTFIRILCIVTTIEFGLSLQSRNQSSEKRKHDFNNRKKWIDAVENDTFPNAFLFGVSISAYQTEGTWDTNGDTVWDHLIREKPNLIKDGSNANIAADFYHKYKEDIQLAKSIGSKVFKISLAWTRILPNGFGGNINKTGINYYNDIINEMIANNIKPMVTLVSGDLPNCIQKWGGFLNPLFVDWFTNFAKIAFTAFGDRVKYWITINEPATLCASLYAGDIALTVNESGTADYYCGHHALLAHSKVYHMYRREFHKSQKGKIGIAHRLTWFEPINGDSDADLFATENSFLWHNGWLMEPIFGAGGDYPKFMKHQIGLKSTVQGYSVSRLPCFTEKQVRRIKGSADFLGINYNGVMMVGGRNKSDGVSFEDDGNFYLEPNWDKLSLWAFAELMGYLNKKYHLPEIYITENGYADTDDIEDLSKAEYLHIHLSGVLQVMQAGINIRGYLVRSLIDSFEWLNGYTSKYGLFRVDFSSPNRTRTPRLSSKLIAEFYKTRSLSNTLKFLGTHIKNKPL